MIPASEQGQPAPGQDPRKAAGLHRMDVVIVGPGRVGLSLALALERAARPPALLLARHPETADARLQSLGLALPLEDIARWTPAAVPQLLVVTVPDDALPAVAGTLAGRLGAASPGRGIAVHTSGVHDGGVLEPLRAAGWSTGSWHPLQTFPDPDAGRFAGVPVAVEGDGEAVLAGRALAEALGGIPWELPAAGKPLYHCLATISCSHVAALLLFCREAAAAFPEPGRGLIRRGYLDLARQTLEQLERAGDARGLTGPALRGDAGTLEIHRRALAEHFPEWTPVYEALTCYLRKSLD